MSEMRATTRWRWAVVVTVVALGLGTAAAGAVIAPAQEPSLEQDADGVSDSTTSSAPEPTSPSTSEETTTTSSSVPEDSTTTSSSVPEETTTTSSSVPEPTTTTTSSTSVPGGKGPDATGPAAFGLCTAWSAHQRNGSTSAERDAAPPWRNLAKAAADAGKSVEDYCKAVLEAKKAQRGPKPTTTTTTPPGTPAPDPAPSSDSATGPGATKQSTRTGPGKPSWAGQPDQASSGKASKGGRNG